MKLDIQRILVPTDFSSTSAHAVEMAIELGRRFGAVLTFFHAHQVPAYVFPDGILPVAPELMRDLEQSIASELQKLVEQARLADVQANTRSNMGVSFVEIVRFAREIEADLIVIGTHGRTGLRHALLGSVAERVVRKATCPVMTVRHPEQRFELP